jgi:tRNA 5-methylaminomethyl-2-thiouridine biosynthesis bifunctional protein
VVIGAGIAGAACAQQLAMRGWQVSVLDAAPQPAAGASALPAGIFAPHTSSDDSVLSRITRAGLRSTGQWAQSLLQHGQDWTMTGVLERRQLATPQDETAAHSEASARAISEQRRHGAHERPASWNAELAEAAAAWSLPAGDDVLKAQQLPADDTALWHANGGWLRPSALVRALLAHANIRFIGNAAVARTEPLAGSHAWSVQNEKGQELAQAELVVFAAGPQSAALAQAVQSGAAQLPLHMQAIRGQVSWGMAPDDASLPQHPVNGHGSWVPRFPALNGGAAAWVMGSSFERDVTELPPTPADQARAHADNWTKQQTLLPLASQHYAQVFEAAHTWAQVRCASNDRLPLVGPLLAEAELPPSRLSPWVCTAMGSRGLTWALLCAELLAARLHGEPLPLPNALAKALSVDRLA